MVRERDRNNREGRRRREKLCGLESSSIIVNVLPIYWQFMSSKIDRFKKCAYL